MGDHRFEGIPAILVGTCSEQRETVDETFRARYGHDYDIHIFETTEELLLYAGELRQDNHGIALVATEMALTDGDGVELLDRVHQIDATSRRIVLLSPGDLRRESPRVARFARRGPAGHLAGDPQRAARRGVPRRHRRDALGLELDDEQHRGRRGADRRPDEDARGRADRRLPAADGHPAPALPRRLRAGSGGRRGHGPGRRVPAGPDAVQEGRRLRHHRPRRDPQQPVARADGGEDVRLGHRPRPGLRGRPRRRRLRTGGPGGCGLRRLRGAGHGRHRVRGDRRPGGDQLDDPQLPGLPARHLRYAARPARAHAGAAVRSPVLRRTAGRGAGAGRWATRRIPSAWRVGTAYGDAPSSSPRAPPTGASASTRSRSSSAAA